MEQPGQPSSHAPGCNYGKANEGQANEGPPNQG